MEQKIYPDLAKMCRLCLKQNAGTIHIFPQEKKCKKYAALSIPMRIMTCAALEVQESDFFPKKICTDCRFQLEKSYYFRKHSQACDAKLRKHLRLIGLGKTSKVFIEETEEEDDDSIDLRETLDFIKEEEEKQQKQKFESLIKEMKLQNEKDLEKIKENLVAKCREDMTSQIRDQLRTELRLEIENDLEERLRKEISEQCLTAAKESVRNEVREECRQLEIKVLLDDLHTYLSNKKNSFDTTVINNSTTNATNPEHSGEINCIVENTGKVEVVRMELQFHDQNVGEKENIAITENTTEDDLNTNDEERESEGNFLIYDTDDGVFDIQPTKPLDQKVEYTSSGNILAEYDEEEFIDTNSAAYEKVNEEYIDTNERCTETTTSYRIEGNENGEIEFLKKCNESFGNGMDEGENEDQQSEEIMVIDFPESLDPNCEGQFEEIKYVKAKKQLTSKSKKSVKTSTHIRTTSTSETVLTKTYVNPLQRSTDTPKIFKCGGCPMVFSTKPSLERHARTHRKLEKTGVNYQCPECRIVVSCSSALRRHMFVHCEEKPFSCTVCEKSFVQKEILKRHMQTHTGIKPHKCPHCERSFAQRINLTQHINRTHLEVPRIQLHSCHLCPKRFNHASGLSRHLASHSGVAFQCSECDRTFGDRSSIKRHVLNMHGSVETVKIETKSKIT